MRPLRPLLLTVTALLLTATPVVGATGADPRRESADRAGDFLAAQITPRGFIAASDGRPNTTNTVRAAASLGLAARGEAALGRALDYLASDVDGATQYQGVVRPGGTGLTVVAVRAGGRDPRDFGGVDLVDRLTSAQVPVGPDAGKLADPLYDGVLNHAIGVIGLRAAHLPADDAVVRAALDWLVAQQCPDGGFQNSSRNVAPLVQRPCTGPDVDSTGYAVQALSAYGVAPRHDAVAWLRTQQSPDGGFGNADSTGLAASALASLGQDTTREAAWLRTLQDEDGGFRYTADTPGDRVYATDEALPGELGVLRPSEVTRFPATTPPAVRPSADPSPAAAPGRAAPDRAGAQLPVTGATSPALAAVLVLLGAVAVRRLRSGATG